MKLSTLGVDKTAKQLVTPYHEDWLRDHADLEYTPEALEFASRQLAAKGRDRRFGFSASGLGGCARAQQFTYMGAQENSTRPRQHQVAHNGTFMHLRWQMAGISAGWLSESEVPIPDNQWRLSGTLDGILHTGEGLELKSCNKHAFSGVMSFGIKEEHNFQVHTYMLATDIDVFSVIYESKDTQDWTEIVVERDELMMQRVKDRAEFLWENSEQKNLLPRLEKCEYKEGWQYEWCSKRVACFAREGWPDA